MKSKVAAPTHHKRLVHYFVICSYAHYLSSSQTISFIVTILINIYIFPDLIKMTVGSGKFISKKVSKVRWMPQYDTSQLESNSLVTGSWDDEVNNVILWSRSGQFSYRFPGPLTLTYTAQGNEGHSPSTLFIILKIVLSYR